MNSGDINLFIGAILSVAATVGVGVKWLLMYIDSQQSKSDLAESAARHELSTRLYDEIKLLRTELANSHAEKRLYLRRIFQLENFIQGHEGLKMPVMDGWPPAE